METLQAPPPLKSTASAPPAPASRDGHAFGLDALDESTRAHLQAGASDTQQGMSGNDLSAPSLQSPGIKVEFHDQQDGPGQGHQGTVPPEPRPQLAAHPR